MIMAVTRQKTDSQGTKTPPRGWRTVKALARELGFYDTAQADPEEACRMWLKRQGVASVRRGRVILVDSQDVDAALRRIE